MKKIVKNLLFVGLGVSLTTPAIVTPLILSNKANDTRNLSIAMPDQLYVNQAGRKVLASNVTTSNANDYISGIPLENKEYVVSIEEIRLPNDQDDGGSILLTLRIANKNNPKSFNSKTYKIDGFMYKSEDAFLKTKLTTKQSARSILPSNLTSIETTKKEIEKYVNGIPDFSERGVEINVINKKADDEVGELSLTLEYNKKETKNNISKKTSIRLIASGFKTIRDVYNEQVNEEFKKFNIQSTTNANKILPSSITSFELLQTYTNGLNNIVLDNDVNWRVENIVPDNNSGTIKFNIVLSKGEGNNLVSVSRTFSISGFKTTAMQDKEDVDSIYEQYIKFKPAVNYSARIVYPSKVNSNNIRNYISNLPSSISNDVQIRYENFLSNDNDGELSFDMKFIKNSYSKSLRFTQIYGFFSENVISHFIKDIKNSITKKSSEYFVRRVDPKYVNTSNITNYLSYNTNNQYGIQVRLTSVRFINIDYAAYLKIGFNLSNSEGLSRDFIVDYALNSLYLNEVYPIFDFAYSNSRILTGEKDRAWQSINYNYNGTIAEPFDSGTFDFNDNSKRLTFIRVKSNFSFLRDFSLYIRIKNPLFRHNLLTTLKFIDVNDLVNNLVWDGSTQSAPSNTSDPIGTNVFFEPYNGENPLNNYIREESYLRDTDTWWVRYKLDKVINGTYFVNYHVSLNTNGKYNYSNNSILFKFIISW